jgi:glycosyltransferase involved in cell wall biosynthesis
MYQPDLSIVLPCYNEEKNIVKNVQNIIRTIKSQLKNVNFEIILVNDGSKDKTYESLLRAEKKFK